MSAKFLFAKFWHSPGNFMTYVSNKEQKLAVCIIAFNSFLIVPQPGESVYADVSWLAAFRVASCDRDMVIHRFFFFFISCRLWEAHQVKLSDAILLHSEQYEPTLAQGRARRQTSQWCLKAGWRWCSFLCVWGGSCVQACWRRCAFMQCSSAVELSLHPTWQIVSGAWHLPGRVASWPAYAPGTATLKAGGMRLHLWHTNMQNASTGTNVSGFKCGPRAGCGTPQCIFPCGFDGVFPVVYHSPQWAICYVGNLLSGAVSICCFEDSYFLGQFYALCCF